MWKRITGLMPRAGGLEKKIHAMGKGSVDERLERVDRVGESDADDAVLRLISCLGDMDERVRLAAAEALEDLGEDQWGGVRRANRHVDVPFHLESAKDPRVFWAHLRVLEHGEGNACVSAANQLAEAADPRAVPALIEKLTVDQAHVRRACAAALSALGDPRAAGPLKRLRKAHPDDPQLTKIVAGALEEIERRRATGRAMDAKSDTRDLVKALKSGGPPERRKAVELLRSRDGQDVFDALAAALSDPDEEVRQAAIEGVGGTRFINLDHSATVPALIRLLEGAQAATRRLAAARLRFTADDRALEPLIRALADEDPEVRRAAADALGRLGNPRAIDALGQALGDPHYAVPKAAVSALAAIKDPEVIPHLLRALAHKDINVRLIVMERLPKHPHAAAAVPDAIAPLVDLLCGGHDLERRPALDALAGFGKPAVAPLIQCLRNPDPRLRKAVAEALAAMNEPGWRALIRGDDGDMERVAKALGVEDPSPTRAAEPASKDAAPKHPSARKLAEIRKTVRSTLIPEVDGGGDQRKALIKRWLENFASNLDSAVAALERGADKQGNPVKPAGVGKALLRMCRHPSYGGDAVFQRVLTLCGSRALERYQKAREAVMRIAKDLA